MSIEHVMKSPIAYHPTAARGIVFSIPSTPAYFEFLRCAGRLVNGITSYRRALSETAPLDALARP